MTTSHKPLAAPSLLINDRMGAEFLLTPGQVFTVGRSGDLAFPDNPYLHRQLIRFDFHDNLWWISNVGGRIALKLLNELTGAPAVLRSGDSDAIVTNRLVVFEAGPTTYEIAVQLTAPPQPPAIDHYAGRDMTVQPGDLNLEQTMLLAAMAEPLLLYPGTGFDRIPSIHNVAMRLGWSTTKTNRKLDYLCERLADDGVTGLVSEGKGSASNRRTRLVEYALDTRLITPASLTLLEPLNPNSSPPS